MKRTLVATCLALLLTGSLRADVAFDPPSKNKLVVELNEAAKQPVLIIPRKLVSDAAPKKGASLPGLSTIVGGLALTLAFASGGLWLARQRRHPAWLFAGLALLGLGVAAAFADRAPPQPKPFAQLDNMRIVVVERGDEIKLIVNKQQLAQLTEAKK